MGHPVFGWIWYVCKSVGSCKHCKASSDSIKKNDEFIDQVSGYSLLMKDSNDYTSQFSD